MQSHVLIVGGGLTGLALAYDLHQAGRSFKLIEARDRLGGRILSHAMGDQRYDLGPTWFWQGQPRLAALISELGLSYFEQYSSGDTLFQTQQSDIIRRQGFNAMQGSFRLRGGMQSFIDGLAQRLPGDDIRLGTLVSKVEPGKVTLSDGSILQGQTIVLTLPPRLAADMAYAPGLHPDQKAGLAAIPTWMGGNAKFVAVYDQPFWRDQGLSGDAMSQRGPMVEIHDASDYQANKGALFGFLGVPAKARKGQEAQIEQACLQQLEQIFGPRAASPIRTFYQDWATEPLSAAALSDAQPLTHHPHYGKPEDLAHVWGGQLILTGTELAPDFGGYLEGALAAAQQTAKQIFAV